MITDPALLRPYLAACPCPRDDLLGVSTWRKGAGPGVFYCLRDGRVINADGTAHAPHAGLYRP